MHFGPNLHLKPPDISLFTSWVLCDVCKTLLEAIEALWMLFGLFRGHTMVGNLGAVGDFTLFCHIFCSNLQLKSHKIHFLYLLGTL